MINIKKINLFVCSLLMVLTSLFFVACNNENYNDVYLSVSNSSIEMEVGDSVELTFTINNMPEKMSNELKFDFSPAGAVKEEIVSQEGNQIVVNITALEAKETSLIATTIDGGKTCAVDFHIKKFSSSLKPENNNLFVSSQNELFIQSSDFIFEEGTSEKELNYYFYGKHVNNDDLTLDNVSSKENGQIQRNFINNFVSVKLVESSDENGFNNKSYLIFTDENNNEFTLGQFSYDLSLPGNIKYNFMPIEKTDDGYYDFTNASSVEIGDEFTFVANYPNSEGKEIFTQKEFVVLKDINSEVFEMDYGYLVFNPDSKQVVSEITYFEDGFDENKITLVPEYTKEISVIGYPGVYADFKNAIIKIFVPGQNNLLKYKVVPSVDNVCNFTTETLVVEGGIEYIINLSTKTTTETDFVLNFNLFYEGFENSENENVSANYQIPVSIKTKPNKIFISSSNFSNVLVNSREFNFYNHYFAENIGWQKFYFEVSPIGSNFKNLQIVLPENCGVLVRYNGTTYGAGQTVVVDNLKNYVEFKGVEGAEIAQNLTLQIKAVFDILKEDEIVYDFCYNILKGSTSLDFVNADFKNQNIGISLNESTGGIDFSDQIVTDAPFDDFDVSLVSGNNVVNFVKHEDVCKENGNLYYLAFDLVPKSIGTAQYSISLPNGRAISLSIQVVETFVTPSISTTNQNANMEIVDFDNNSATIYARFNSEYKDVNNYFDLKLLANGLENSNAIINFTITSSNPEVISISDLNKNEFNVKLHNTGTSRLTFNIKGYKVENFVVSYEENISYEIIVVSYEYINELNIFKLKDGQSDEYSEGTFARYVYLYDQNANSVAKKQAQFEINISSFNSNISPYLFKNQATGLYDYSKFNQKYVYWTVPGGYSVYLNGNLVPDGKMYLQESGNSSYEIKLLSATVATFDAQSLTLTLTNEARMEFMIVANIDQYGIATKSYTINLKILYYDVVENLSALTPTQNLSFSAIKTSQEFNLRILQSTAINKNIKIFLSGDSFTADNETYKIFGEYTNETYEGITINISGSVANIVLTVDNDFIDNRYKMNTNFNATLTIAAEDWYDDSGKLLDKYSGKLIKINISFENGTVENPYLINNVEDFEKIGENLNSHYKIISTIDVSSIVSKLPFGKFNGSIVGSKDYSKIVGLNLVETKQDDDNQNAVYAGLFTELSETAKIANLYFEGAINLTTEESVLNISGKTAYVGLIAGVNNGIIENVSISLNSSQISFEGNKQTGDSNEFNTAFVGGVVGVNHGQIIQDFSQKEEGEYKLYSYMVYMNNLMNISYQRSDIFVGGIAGLSDGLIKKIDEVYISGYSNYLAYSLIKTNLNQSDGVSVDYVGAVAGKIAISGNAVSNGNVTKGLVSYSMLNNQETLYNENTYSAGKGIVCGGEVEGLSNVGGVVGYLDINSSNTFAGITVRTFAKALSEETGIGFFSGNINTGSGVAINPSLYVQAIDDGKIEENSSMLVIYKASNSDKTFDLSNLNLLAFGINSSYTGSTFSQTDSEENQGENGSAENNSNQNDKYFISYLKREKKELTSEEDSLEISGEISLYYGEVVIVENDLIIDQYFFNTKGENADLSVSASFGNEMISNLSQTENQSQNKVFYAFHFNTLTSSENSEEGLKSVQQLLNENFNTLYIGDSLYPFIVTGELTLTSQNTSILKISQNGTITIQGTGWVRITGKSILNINEGVNFNIFVTNYFNNSSDVSIIYPDVSENSSAFDETTISMFADDTAVMYVRPDYTFSNTKESENSEDNDVVLNIDKFGVGVINNYQFNLVSNNNISAKIEIDDSEFNYSVNGQTIVVTKKQSATESQQFNVKITPVLKAVLDNVEYSAQVNKELSKININYQKGAIAIGSSTYDTLAISTNNIAYETIIVKSTADLESEGIPGEGLDYYISFNNEIIQQSEDSNSLFNVIIKHSSTNSSDELIKEYRFSLSISVNKNSQAFINRFENNIYGEYKIVVISKTNKAQYLTINLILENLPLQSIVIDNYNDFDSMTKENGIGQSSEYSYAGNSSLLAVTLSPEDSDFDYLTIENASDNYLEGRGNATFELAARKNSVNDNKEALFDVGVISGSATSTGLLLTKNEILQVYNDLEIGGVDLYKDYSGVVYFKYEIGNSGVNEDSISSFVVNVYKDNNLIKSSYIDLKIKLNEMVSISIADKEPEEGEYNTYRVARGLKYKLNVQSYGFNDENINIEVIENNQYASIIKENGEYYLQISDLNLPNDNAVDVVVQISASRMDGETPIYADNEMTVIVMNYVVNSSLNNAKNVDVVSDMVDGVITMPIGTSKSLYVNIYNYIEYDSTNQLVVNYVKSFIDNLTKYGEWKYYTNIENGADTPASDAGKASYEYDLPVNGEGENYYFKYNNLSIIPTRINDYEKDFYYVTYQGFYKVSGSGYSYTGQGDSSAMTFSTKISFDVFVSSSEESPIPIFTYQDFLEMKSGGHYILLNDIVLPSKEYVESDKNKDGLTQYMPLSGNFASLDGNGHSIKFDGTYDFGNSDQLGVFSTLNSGSVIKNLNVKLLSSYDTGNSNFGVIFETTNANKLSSLLVASNNGIITNCEISAPTDTYFTVEAPLAGVEAAYFGSVAGENNGYITNCNSSINVQGAFNIAGLVGKNNGKIASCYFAEGVLQSIENQLGEGYHVAGLVNINMNNGLILTSYTTSGISSQSIYSTNKNSFLTSSNYSAGFVYKNQGEIQDSYSDMYLAKSDNMAGFAFINTGKISNSFSLSVLQSNTIASAGFAMRNVDIEEGSEGDYNQGDNSGQGTFENCYYLTHSHSTSDNCAFTESVNINLNTVTFEGIEGIDDFDNMEHFSSYAYNETVNTKSVWFLSKNGEENSDYIKFYESTESSSLNSDIGVQVNNVYDYRNIVLPKGRLELSSPNIDSLSIRNYVDSYVNDSTGDITYNYEDDIQSNATRKAERGSLYNPYLIYSAETMESLILENNAPSTNQNTKNYRLICDIDYSSYQLNSQIYNTVFGGSFEGNGMEIKSIVLQSNSTLDYAGMFAKLGISSSKAGVIKNLTLSPKSVTFANAVSVGALVGFISNGSLYNINVLTEDSLSVVGSNFVGGIVGRAQGNYSLKNLYSNVNAISNYTPNIVNGEEVVVYKEHLNANVFSYSGGIAGHLGSGYAENLTVENISTVRGDRTGLVAGGIGQNANVSFVKVYPNASTKIKAYRYGGIAVGEVVGTLKEVVVYDNGIENYNIFSIDQIPLAVGGIAGVISGGVIEKAVMQQSFNVSSKKIGVSSVFSTIESVGGIVGLVGNAGSAISTISQSIVLGNISCSSSLGGAIGQLTNSAKLDQIAIKSSQLSVSGQREVAILGGIVGNIASNPVPLLEITNSYCQANLTINTQNALNLPIAKIGGLIAVETSNMTLKNCYTRSYITVLLKNMNSINKMESFNGVNEEGEEGEVLDNIVSFYKQKNNNGENIKNTYYYGAIGVGTENQNSGSGVGTVGRFVTCESNFELSSDYCEINNYGQSSYSDSGSSASYSKDALKNIIFDDNNNIWTGKNPEEGDINPNTSFRILVFENNLYWI